MSWQYHQSCAARALTLKKARTGSPSVKHVRRALCPTLMQLPCRRACLIRSFPPFVRPYTCAFVRAERPVRAAPGGWVGAGAAGGAAAAARGGRGGAGRGGSLWCLSRGQGMGMWQPRGVVDLLWTSVRPCSYTYGLILLSGYETPFPSQQHGNTW